MRKLYFQIAVPIASRKFGMVKNNTIHIQPGKVEMPKSHNIKLTKISINYNVSQKT